MAKKQTATKWEIRKIDLTELKPFSRNPRTINDKNRNALKASLARFGYVDLIIWNQQTGNIVGGHQRYKLLVEQGVKQADVIVVDLTESEELAANLTMNNPAIEGEWDDPIGDLLQHLEGKDKKFFDEANFAELRDAVDFLHSKTGEQPAEESLPEADAGIPAMMKCPCCGSEWEVSDSDIQMMSVDEIARLGEVPQ